MTQKKFLALMLAGVLSLGVTSTPVYAAKGDADGGRKDPADVTTNTGSIDTDTDKKDDTNSADADKKDDTNSADGSSTVDTKTYTLTIPSGLEDGNYTGDAVVEPDDDDGFNFYPISVNVAISNGSIESFLVTGATGQNTQYSKRAETGINTQLSGKSAGTYTVDAVSMATCSSSAIVDALNAALQSDPTGTTKVSLSDAVYVKSGTPFYITIKDPKEGTDYSDISISHALGKFSQELKKDTDYNVALISESSSEIVYKVTILPTGSYEIEDDDLTHSGSYNKLGQTLDVTVAGSSAGRVAIYSSAAVTLKNNVLTLTGGNGETLEDFISNIGKVTISYIDENGEKVSTSYTTKWQHDIEPEFTGADFFNADGSVNFSIAPFVNGANGDYTMTVESEGFDVLTDIPVGKTAAVKPGTDSDTNTNANGSNTNTNDSNTNTNGSNTNMNTNTNGSNAANNSTGVTAGNKINSTTGNSTATSTNTSNTTAPKTGDSTPLAMWTSIFALSAFGIGTMLTRRRRRS